MTTSTHTYTEVVTDKLRQPIQVNDIIAYPIMRGDSTQMALGKVVAIKEPKPHARDSQFHLTVHGLDDNYGWRTEGMKLNARKGTILDVKKVIVLPPSIIPTEHLLLFDQVPPLGARKTKNPFI